jgi:DNA-binding IclR family transcriptional regulator
MATQSWTFLTNHAHVLLCLVQDADLRIRDLAQRVGITERAVQRILHDLVEAEYLGVEKAGRRNHYTVRLDQPLRHPVEQHADVSRLVTLVAAP